MSKALKKEQSSDVSVDDAAVENSGQQGSSGAKNGTMSMQNSPGGGNAMAVDAMNECLPEEEEEREQECGVEQEGGGGQTTEDPNANGEPGESPGDASTGSSPGGSGGGNPAAGAPSGGDGDGGGDAGQGAAQQESAVDSATSEQQSTEGGGSTGPISLQDVSPDLICLEDWGAVDKTDAQCIDVMPVAPSPNTSTPGTNPYGQTTPGESIPNVCEGTARYSRDQRYSIANEAVVNGLSEGGQTAALGFGIDLLGVAGQKGSQHFLAKGTSMGKVLGGTAGTAVPILGGVLSGVNLYNTFKDYESNFVEPFGNIFDSDLGAIERIASLLDLVSSIISVLSDVLAIAGMVCAIAGVITAITGAGAVIGAGTAAALTSASLYCGIAALAISAIAAGLRYYLLVSSEGDPQEVEMHAEKLQQHTAGATGELGGLASNAATERIETKVGLNSNQSDIDQNVSSDIENHSLSNAAPVGTEAQTIPVAEPSNVGKINQPEIEVAPTVQTDAPEIKPSEVIVPNQAEINHYSDPNASPMPNKSGGIIIPGAGEIRQYGGKTGQAQVDAQNAKSVPILPADHEMPTGKGVDALRESGYNDADILRVKSLRENVSSVDPNNAGMTPQDLGTVAESGAIIDSAVRQPGEGFRKIESPNRNSLDANSSQYYDPHKTKGFVGHQDTTNGQTPDQIVKTLGLGYGDKSNVNGPVTPKSYEILDAHGRPINPVTPGAKNKDGASRPYLDADDRATDRVFQKDFTLDETSVDQLVVPAHKDVADQLTLRDVPNEVTNREHTADPFTGKGAPIGDGLSNEYKVRDGETIAPKEGMELSEITSAGERQLPKDYSSKVIGAGQNEIDSNGANASAPQTDQTPGKSPKTKTRTTSAVHNVVSHNEKGNQTPPPSKTVGGVNQLLNMLSPQGSFEPFNKNDLKPEDCFTTPKPIAPIPETTSITYDYSTEESMTPPVSEPVGLEELPSAPHDMRQVATTAPIALGLEVKSKMLEARLQMQDGMLANKSTMLGSEGPFAALNYDQQVREQHLSAQQQESSSVDKGVQKGEQKSQEVEKKSSEASSEQAKGDTGAVDTILSVASNSAVRGLVKVGGGIAKVGAGIVNGIGSLFGADEPVIDTSTIDKIDELIDVAPEMRSKRNESRSNQGQTGEADQVLKTKVSEQRERLGAVEAQNTNLESENAAIRSNIESERSLVVADQDELLAEKGKTEAQLQAVESAKSEAASHYDAEMSSLAAWQQQYNGVKSRNQERLDAANNYAAAPSLTGAQSSAIQSRLSIISQLEVSMVTKMTSAQNRIASCKSSGQKRNGMPFPTSFDSIAQGVVSNANQSYASQIQPLLAQMRMDLNTASPDRVHIVCNAVDATIRQVEHWIDTQYQHCISSIDSVYAVSPNLGPSQEAASK